MTKSQTSFFSYFRLVVGFCGIVLLVVGSLYLAGDLLNRTTQFGPSAWLEFDGPIITAMLVINIGVVATIIVVIAKRLW